MWGLSFEWGSPKWGRGCEDTGQPQVPWPRWSWEAAHCLGAGLNQLGPSGKELPRPWHQTLISRDPAPGEATEEKAAGKIQFELARRLPAWETSEERTSSNWWLLGPWQCQPVRGELPASGSHQPQAPDSSLGTHAGALWPQRRAGHWPGGGRSPECPGVKRCPLGSLVSSTSDGDLPCLAPRAPGLWEAIQGRDHPANRPWGLCSNSLHPKKAAGRSRSGSAWRLFRPQTWLQALQSRGMC